MGLNIKDLESAQEEGVIDGTVDAGGAKY